ncbi:hypothetical protein [Absidia glauca]|uniref:C3H1-type domain-containing protein n=1 Tax=Absidia glauca TaxID=4829 RepID=A0A168RWN0_ABSGL|nr:hypothetical protein [Absidia glauca]
MCPCCLRRVSADYEGTNHNMAMMRNVCGYLATRDARTVFSEQEDSPHVCFAFHRSDADPQDKSYMPKQAQSSATTTEAAPTTTAPTSNTTSSEPNNPTEDKDDDEDDEDDDTNFKRRSNNNKSSPTIEAKGDGSQTQKRSFAADDNTDNGPLNKQQRYHSPGGQNAPSNYSMQQRLGPRQFVKKPCFNYQNKGYCMRGDFCPYDHGDNPLVMETNGTGMMEAVDRAGGNYNGGDAGGPMRIRGRGARHEGGFDGNKMGNRRQEDVPYTNRYTPYSTKIVVEKIPEENCNIDSVTGFFGKFGKLVNLSVQPDVSRAFLQYASHQEAMAAYQSPAVIFNNRFVKVFWQKVNEEEERKEFIEQQRLASQPDPEAVKAKAAQLAKEREERQKKQQEHLKKVLELQKHQQQLIERQIEEQKKLMERYEHALPGSKEREEIMTAINNLSDSIKSNKATALSSTAAIPSQPSAPTSSSSTASSSPPSAPSPSAVAPSPPTTPTTLDAKKAEMERLKAKLASLEAAKKSGYASHRGGRGGMNTWPGRGGARTFSIDNRKKMTPPQAAATSTTDQQPQPPVDSTHKVEAANQEPI